jgi:hypothetical protein
MLPLKHRTDYHEYGHQNRCFFKGYQAASHRRADTIGRIIGTNIPTDISTGAQQDEEYQFDGGFTSVLLAAGVRKIFR